jgi:TrwC relaxase
MSLHKLTAGSGYDHLTRQVAALDATEKGHTGLASYYTERGESPGLWIGSGMDRIDGLAAGDAVTAEQMRALFGCGLHPLAELRQQQLEGPDLTLLDFQNVARLGAPFKIVDNDLRPFRLEVAKRIAALNTAIGWPADASIAAADRARVRTQVAREFFLAEHGREPIDARELTGQIAKDSPHRGAAGPQRAASSPVIVAKRQRRLSSIDEIVLSMYAGIQADDHLIEAAEPPRPLLH